MNSFNPEDPKWTAYLLGECSETDIKAIEAELEANPEAKNWLEEMHSLESDLSTHFAEEPALELQDLQKERIQEQVPARRSKGLPSSIYSLAAALVIVITGVVLMDTLGTFGPEIQSESDLMGVKVVDAPQYQDIEVIEEIEEEIMPEEVVSNYMYGGRTVQTNEVPLDADSFSTVSSDSSSPVRSSGLSIARKEEGGQTQRMDPTDISEMHADQGAVNFYKKKDQGVVAPVSAPAGPHRSRRQSADQRFGGEGGQNLSLAMPTTVNGFMDAEMPPTPALSPSQDEFDVIDANPFRKVQDHPLSTFSIDVDTASYSVVRKMLKEGRLPSKDAVRIEEMINYFDYDYAAPTDGSPFAAHMQIAECPWAPEHHLVRVALKGEVISAEERPALNLVYLLDVSGSMSGGNRLPLVKRAMKTLVSQLDERDRVAIVVYAGAAGLVLPSTSGADDPTIINALDRLNAGGSTAGGAGIKLAYQTAREQFVEGGVNRVILCTDGDFNVGLNQTGDLQKLIEKEAKSGVQLTVLGFGMGNYKDDTLETLSNKGNGNYAYIDDFKEARKVLVEDLLGNMITIAKDVKIQVEFNPAFVEGYRLVGYENRMLKKEDFNNDKVDAGEIGAGHTVTALYEVVPAGKPVPGEVPAVDDLKYRVASAQVLERAGHIEQRANVSREVLTLKLRHKEPDGDVSTKTEFPLSSSALEESDPDQDFRFATAVASFGFWLRDPDLREEISIQEILNLATSGKGTDPLGYRSEFIQLVRAAEAIKN